MELKGCVKLLKYNEYLWHKYFPIILLYFHNLLNQKLLTRNNICNEYKIHLTLIRHSSFLHILHLLLMHYTLDCARVCVCIQLITHTYTRYTPPFSQRGTRAKQPLNRTQPKRPAHSKKGTTRKVCMARAKRTHTHLFEYIHIHTFAKLYAPNHQPR